MWFLFSVQICFFFHLKLNVITVIFWMVLHLKLVWHYTWSLKLEWHYTLSLNTFTESWSFSVSWHTWRLILPLITCAPSVYRILLRNIRLLFSMFNMFCRYALTLKYMYTIWLFWWLELYLLNYYVYAHLILNGLKWNN